MDEIREQLERIVKDLFAVDVQVSVTPAPESTGADYASNVAMQLAKVIHKPPMVIAQVLKDEFSGRITLSELATTPSQDAKSSSVRCSALPRTSSQKISSGELDDGEAILPPGSKERNGMLGVTVEIAQPGFLNFKVSNDDVAEQVRGFAEDFKNTVTLDDYAGKEVVAEFSDPNPFKVLHVGHLYTSIVGDSISRLLEFAGAKVVKANFGGDVGLHVAKTLYSVLATCNEPGLTLDITSSDSPVRGRSETLTAGRAFGDESKLSPHSSTSAVHRISNTAPLRASNLPRTDTKLSPGFESLKQALHDLTIEDIARNYVEGTRAYEEDEAAKAEITRLNKEIYRINEEDLHDSALAQLYWRGRELSYQYFDEFYERIGVKFDKYYPESMVAGRGVREVKAHTGTTYEESDGAIVYHGEKVGLHTRVFINREGVPTYETKDVGLIFTKWDDWHFDESIVVTGNEQSDYMKVVLASVSEYAPKLVERTTHLTHGLVKLPGNVKMSSRKGNFLKAVDVLQLVDSLLKRPASSESSSVCCSTLPHISVSLTSSDELVDSSSSLNSTYSEQCDEVDEDSHKVLLAAIKYAFLKYKMGGDIVFDPKESVSTTGNSGVYLLYSAVRARKILQKQGKSEDSGELTNEEQKYTKDLNKRIVQYRDVLREAVKEKAPYKVCNYLYELAQEFSRFYEHVKVAGSNRENELMRTVQAYANVMEHGAGLLGISIPEEM